MEYRADLDGLRGLAVTLVVLFHSGLPGVSGGFVGVDVFFVLSGFLITSIVLRDIERDAFSIAGFYERRVRRLLPALSLVFLVSALLSLYVASPFELVLFGRSLLTAALFCSNFLFSNLSGYFQPRAETFALLHTWSLAIEEQFYLVYPPLLLLITRYARRLQNALILGGLAISLALSLALTDLQPTESFYLPHTRAWELLLGAALAKVRVGQPSRGAAIRGRALSGALAGVGLLLILGSAYALSGESTFPGAVALAPCLGAALLIQCGETRNPVTWLLAQAPLRALGLVSYSLYLWHWPLLLFARQLTVRPLSSLEVAITLAVSLLLSALSWRFIEQPLRDRSFLSRRTVLLGGALVTALLAGVGAGLWKSDGLPSRFGEYAHLVDLKHASRPRLTYGRDAKLLSGRLGSLEEPRFALLGDSHALVLSDPVSEVVKELGRPGTVYTVPGCPPVPGVTRTSVRGCELAVEEALASVERSETITRVFVIARWSLYAEGTRYRGEYGPKVWLADADSRGRGVAENQRVLRQGLTRTIERLQAHQKRVILVGPIPEIGYDVPTTIAKVHHLNLDFELEPTRAMFEARQRFALELLPALAEQHALELLYPHETLCDQARCAVSEGGELLYDDSNHLTDHGARLLAERLGELLTEPATSKPATQPSKRPSKLMK